MEMRINTKLLKALGIPGEGAIQDRVLKRFDTYEVHEVVFKLGTRYLMTQYTRWLDDGSYWNVDSVINVDEVEEREVCTRQWVKISREEMTNA